MCLQIRNINKDTDLSMQPSKEFTCYKIYGIDTVTNEIVSPLVGTINGIVEKDKVQKIVSDRKRWFRKNNTLYAEEKIFSSVYKGIHVFTDKNIAQEIAKSWNESLCIDNMSGKTAVAIPVKCFKKDLISSGFCGLLTSCVPCRTWDRISSAAFTKITIKHNDIIKELEKCLPVTKKPL